MKTFLMGAIEVGAAVSCPACGARFDIEWEALRTVGDSRRWSASVTGLTPAADA